MTKRRFRGLVLRGVMTRDVDALLCAFILTMLACACGGGGGGEARVRLNSIRTVVVHKGPEASFNRSAWELTLRQCISDLECKEGSYCHAPDRRSAHSRCRTCRRRKKRCHRDGMCCPGNFCSNSACVREATASQQIALQHVAPSPKARWRKRDKMELSGASGQGQVGDPCLTSADCWDELCCARHLWTRICKPVLQEGQVCSARRRKRRQGGLELFQRCPCAQGLACRAPPAAGPPSSPLMAAAESKLAAYSRRPRLHAVKARLHECRRK